MLNQLVRWLGPRRARMVIALVVGAGLTSLLLQVTFRDAAWLLSGQLGVIWLLFGGLAVVLGSRLPRQGQRRLWLALGPGLLLLGLGVLVPDWVLFFGGAGLGWMVAAQLVLRNRVRMEYQAAIRHLRRSEYDQAVAIMDTLVQAEPDRPEHRRFRAELHRLAGDSRKAIVDYERVVALDPQATAGYTGLAEVYVQQGDYDRARDYALAACERDPSGWMVAYNLGLIEDRRGASEAVVEHVRRALAAGIPHSRYRLLARLWLARAYHRQGQPDAAREQVDQIRRQAAGLREWDVVFASEQASALRGMLEADVQLARQLVDGHTSLDVLGDAQGGT